MHPATAPTFPGAAPTARQPSCVRLLFLADGAIGTPPVRVPNNGAGGPHGFEMLPAPEAGAAPVRSRVSTPSRAALTRVPDHASSGTPRLLLAVAVSTPAPATAPRARVGLIERSTRPDGLSIRPSSTRPVGLLPAGVTEGELT